jgi:chromosome segregation ATPase
MTAPNPQQQVHDEIDQLQSAVSSLRSKVSMTDVINLVSTLDNQINGLPARLTDLRGRGYAFEKTLETTTSDLKNRWNGQHDNIQMQLNSLVSQFRGAMAPIDAEMARLWDVASNATAAQTMIAPLRNQINNLENRANSAQQTINAMIDAIKSDADKLIGHLDQVDNMLKQLAEASFQLLPSESGVMAVKAVWAREGKETKDDPEGILFLTDQRLIFEQKQEVATKKVMFVVTEKKMVQEKLFESALTQIEDVNPSKQGLFKNEDFIDLKLANGSFAPTAKLHIWQDGDEWLELINRVKSGEFIQNRTVPLDQAVVDKAKAAPTQCPNCGGVFTKPVLRGQESITCEFCGAVIKL